MRRSLLLGHFVIMHPQMLAFAFLAVIFFAIRYLSRTDTPKIKNLPEIPGVPIFGNLIQLGSAHAKVAGSWAKKFGPVFQVRLGNKVKLHPRAITSNTRYLTLTTTPIENRLRQHLRLRQALLGHQPVRADLAPQAPHLPHRRLQLCRLHHRDLALG